MQNPSLVLETKYATNKQFYVNEYYFSLLVTHMKGVIFTPESFFSGWHQPF